MFDSTFDPFEGAPPHVTAALDQFQALPPEERRQQAISQWSSRVKADVDIAIEGLNEGNVGKALQALYELADQLVTDQYVTAFVLSCTAGVDSTEVLMQAQSLMRDDEAQDRLSAEHADRLRAKGVTVL